MSATEDPFSFAIVIGRFQPFHKAHAELVQQAFASAQHGIIALGSHLAAPDIKNPWNSAQRETMIRDSLSAAQQPRPRYAFCESVLKRRGLGV